MALLSDKNAVVKYANGDKMSRIVFDINYKTCKKFKRLLLVNGQTLAGVLRPVVEQYIKDNWSPELR